MTVMVMAEYTVELREYIESFRADGMTLKMVIELGRTYLFDFDYPIFDVAYKKEFETKFIRNFYLREIGVETMGLFKFRLETWLTINMPYFNKMYESIVFEDKYSPLDNAHKVTTSTKETSKSETKTGTVNGTTAMEQERKTEDNNTMNANGSNFNRDVESDTPDTRLALSTEDGTGVIEYASRIEEQKNTNTNEQSSEGFTNDNTNMTEMRDINNSESKNDEETENFTFTTTGKIGVQTYAKLLQEYRANILNVDNMVFKEMQQLFMLVY